MTIGQHVETFAGQAVFDFDPGQGFSQGQPGTVAYRLAEEYEGEQHLPELLDRYLGEPGAEETTVLVIGPWGETMFQEDNHDIVQALVAARDRLPRLRALFLGDITYNECEISWINQGDLSPLLAAYPKLEEFRVRGVVGLTFGRLRHSGLRVLTIESGGLPAQVLEELWVAELPNLEKLELWLGTSWCGGIDDPAPLAPLLSSQSLPLFPELSSCLFPKLTSLGLRNSAIADAVAAAAATSPILQQISALDLSLGNLSDEGARALIASPGIRRLARLDIHHHYVSPAVVAELQGLGIAVDASDVQEPDTDTHDGVTETYRYNAVSE